MARPRLELGRPLPSADNSTSPGGPPPRSSPMLVHDGQDRVSEAGAGGLCLCARRTRRLGMVS